LPALLKSVLAQSLLPAEVIITEDCSPERNLIRTIVNEFSERFCAVGIELTYHENTENLGYDGNLRSLVSLAKTEYILFLGNDDELCPDAVQNISARVAKNACGFVSRDIVRHEIGANGTSKPLSRVRYSRGQQIDGIQLADVGLLFSLACVISGLAFRTKAAQWASTRAFDGSLYYQFHLALVCNKDSGTLYINEPIVRCRSVIAPDFGQSIAERQSFTPGSYSAKSRVRMAKGVIDIAMADSDTKNWKAMLRREFNLMQSVHIFEMIQSKGRFESLRLFWGFAKLGLFIHPFPLILLGVNIMFGRHVELFAWSKRLVKKILALFGVSALVRASALSGPNEK